MQVVETGQEYIFRDLWAASAHADAEAEAFVHWDEDGEIPSFCAKCHSTPGFIDFLGLDGTEAGVVDTAAVTGTVVTCETCHNEATVAMDSVTFPSGVVVSDLGPEARCMQCHQGRASTVAVEEAITNTEAADMDAVVSDLNFVNIHYFAAAATQLGHEAAGGYQYEGKSYDGRFAHVEEFDTCVECHDPHALEVDLGACSTCHTEVTEVEDLKDIRMVGSSADYDGDGDVEEGLHDEIAGLQTVLYQALQAYASDVAGTPLVYDAHGYPYFFIDTNGDGEANEDEVAFPNQYNAWTPRLLKAAYNYQVSLKDPGAFAHNGKYVIQLLYDSIEDLDADLVSGLARSGAGHFAGAEEAWRHWDEEGAVDGDCAKCHSATGLPTFLAEGANISEEPSNGLLCTTCHDDLNTYSRYAVEQVTFPSGAALNTGDVDSNLCLNCHQGRQSGVGVDARIGDRADDTVVEDLGFLNVHYFAAGATLFGEEAHGAYEYAGQTYVGRFTHVEGYDTCIECHDAHDLELQLEDCTTCHAGVERAAEIRMAELDYDGDGNVTEGVAAEIDALRETLYAAIQTYAADVVEVPIVYDAHRYPYFFLDSNANGAVDPGEAIYPNKYNAWTPRLLRAAYNYQYVSKDPGAFAHNAPYVLQILYDSLADLSDQVPSVDVEPLIRPEGES
jgi:hypothetical protein